MWTRLPRGSMHTGFRRQIGIGICLELNNKKIVRILKFHYKKLGDPALRVRNLFIDKFAL